MQERMSAHHTGTSSIREHQYPSIRVQIASRTHPSLQAFLSWLTACPTMSNERQNRTSDFYVWLALGQVGVGIAISWTGAAYSGLFTLPLIILGLTATTAGLALLQVGVFHYCSHYTVFKRRSWNDIAGRLVAAVCFLEDFDLYRRRHMRHHSSRVLLTDEDEFVELIMKTCNLAPGTPKSILWFRVVRLLVSPTFHARFILKRFAMATHRTPIFSIRTVILALWASVTFWVALSGQWLPFLISVVLPWSLLFQISVVVRTLCEHVVPNPDAFKHRSQDFHSHATRAVFAGLAPPECSLASMRGAIRWALWWLSMLTHHLLFRIVILVGDSACHDLHHRKPGSRNWVNYIQARYDDVQERLSLGKMPSHETWGLYQTIDSCLDSIAKCRSLAETDHALRFPEPVPRLSVVDALAEASSRSGVKGDAHRTLLVEHI